jgi:multidrug efflux pump
MFAQLKPLAERKLSSDQVIARLRGKTAKIPGAQLYMQSVQDLSIGGRFGGAQYQYTLQAENLNDLNHWAPILLQRLQKVPGIFDVNTDQQVRGLQSSLVIDRDTASRLGVNMTDIDNTLGDAFGQRQVSNIYKGLNQYHVVLEVSDQYTKGPEGLTHIYVPGTGGKLVPLSSFAHYKPSNTSLSVNHQGLYPSITLSFNLGPGLALGDAVTKINALQRELGLPPTVHGGFQGTAQAFQDSQSSMAVLIITAIGAVYIILGILYESYIHPITILSTIPSAGVGALLALQLTHTELSMIALIGIILLIGIVKKNAILMVDFAVQAEMQEGKSPVDAIHQACLLRFRPILMTTMAALFGALPLALGQGVGSELRRPLGIAIVGGLIMSQLLTLFTTPVVYLYLDRAQSALFASREERLRRHGQIAPAHSD